MDCLGLPTFLQAHFSHWNFALRWALAAQSVAQISPVRDPSPAAKQARRRHDALRSGCESNSIYAVDRFLANSGSNRVPLLSMAQATLRSRSMTERKARAWP